MPRDIYIQNSLIPKRYLQDIKLVPAKIDEQTFIYLNNYKNSISDHVMNGDNLLIYSSKVGNGKTTWATKILREYIEYKSPYSVINNCPGIYINVNNFLSEKKRSITEKSLSNYIIDIEKKLLSSHLVVFDDIGVKNQSDFDLGALYYWIDYRTSNMKSCIFTSNVTPEQLKNVLDERLYSRIVKYSIVKEIKDGDNREC